MHFHFPPSLQWDPQPLYEQLLHHGADATVIGSSIHVLLSSDVCDAWREYCAQRAARRGRSRPRIDKPHVSVRYHPDRFLRNLEVHRKSHMVPLTEPRLKLIENMIRKLGGELLDSDDREFSIAYQYCPDRNAVDRFRVEIEKLLRQKQEFVQQLDFQSAFDIHNREHEVRSQLDTLLFHGR